MLPGETLEKFLDREVRPDTKFLSDCSQVIDTVVRLIHRNSKYKVNQVIKVSIVIPLLSLSEYKKVCIQTAAIAEMSVISGKTVKVTNSDPFPRKNQINM